MNKASASLIMQSAISMDKPINDILKHAETLPEGEEREQLFKAMADVMGIITAGVVFPIIAQYRELDPDQ